MRHGHKGHHGHKHGHKGGNHGHHHGHGKWKEKIEKLAQENPEFSKLRQEFREKNEDIVKNNPDLPARQEALVKLRQDFKTQKNEFMNKHPEIKEGLTKQKHEAFGHKHKGWEHKCGSTKTKEKATDSSFSVKVSETAAFDHSTDHFEVETLGTGVVAEGFGV